MSAIFSTSRLVNKTVLITGASGGIGAATAILFAKAGANLIISARRPDKLAEVKSAAVKANAEGGSGGGGKVFEWVQDVQDRRGVDRLFEVLPAEFKKIDVLVNNAGLVFGRETVGDVNEQDMDIMFQTNVLGMIHLTQLVVRREFSLHKRLGDFKENKSGHVISLGSVAGREGYSGGSIYCATKHALRGFNVALMKELYDTPIRVTEIQPGLVETCETLYVINGEAVIDKLNDIAAFSITRFRGDESAAKKVYEGMQPLTAEDVAEDIVWAASRKPHINVAETFVLPVNQASPTLVYKGGN